MHLEWAVKSSIVIPMSDHELMQNVYRSKLLRDGQNSKSVKGINVVFEMRNVA
jgi:hypothetical protein